MKLDLVAVLAVLAVLLPGASTQASLSGGMTVPCCASEHLTSVCKVSASGVYAPLAQTTYSSPLLQVAYPLTHQQQKIAHCSLTVPCMTRQQTSLVSEQCSTSSTTAQGELPGFTCLYLTTSVVKWQACGIMWQHTSLQPSHRIRQLCRHTPQLLHKCWVRCPMAAPCSRNCSLLS